MTDIERSIEIDAPVEQVFQYAADWQNWPKFFEGVSEFSPTTETTRGNGARHAYKAEMLGIDGEWKPIDSYINDKAFYEGALRRLQESGKDIGSSICRLKGPSRR